MDRIKWFNAVRAYGLFLVLGYHLFYDVFPGGFLGVDIFFTFSGFLVTALAIEEVRKSGGFSLSRFYKRRAQRIVIPLYLSVAFTLPFMLLISPDFTVGITRQTAAALGFVKNWFQILTGGSYEAQLLPSVYVHTWSLAIEAQFYLSWGLVCVLLAALSKAIFSDNEGKRLFCFRALLFALSGVLAVASYIFMNRMHDSGYTLDAIYFNTFARFFPFLIGSLAASIWGVHDKERVAPYRRRKLITAALIAVAALSAAFILYESRQYKFTDDFIYHYGFLITSLLTAALIYATHGLHLMTPKTVREPRLLTSVADMSYNAYLFHWPFYVVFSALILNNTTASLVTLAFTFVFSALMFYKVERIFISKGHSGALKHRRFAASILCAALVVAAVPSGIVIHRAPAITSIETDFAVNNVLMDAQGIMSFERGVSAINPTPVTYAVSAPLQANLLSAYYSVYPPAPAPELTPAPDPPANNAVTLEITGGVTVIGDSVPLGAQAAMIKLIPNCYVDAVVSRPVSAGHGIVMDLISRGELREYVVIALGTNGASNYESLLSRIIDDLPSGHRLIFVTPFDGRSNENSRILNNTAAWMRGLPSQYNFITIADWNSLISPQANILAGDRVHMGGQTSMDLYANMVAEAISAASQKPAKE